jgi:hypothetical protein
VRPHHGIRTKEYKLIHYVREPQEFELHDLAIGPGESRNLYGDQRYVGEKWPWKRMQELEAQIPERPKIRPAKSG